MSSLKSLGFYLCEMDPPIASPSEAVPRNETEPVEKTAPS